MILNAATSWNDFWAKVGDFFWAKDDSGINYLTRIIIAVLIIVIAYFLIKFIGFLLKKAMKIKKKGPDIDISAKLILITLIKVFLWLAVAFIVINLLKIDTTGIAGLTSAITVALGLALQDLILCFASGLIILQQKTIATGDYISVQNSYGKCDGTVVKIHFFFTFLKTPTGQEVTIPNNNMLQAVITNYTRLGKRRLDYDVGVAYNTDIKLAKSVLSKLLENDERIIKEEGITVYVYELGAYSVGLRIRVWTPVDNYWTIYNELSEKVLLAFRENNIVIPSSTDISVNEKK